MTSDRQRITATIPVIWEECDFKSCCIFLPQLFLLHKRLKTVKMSILNIESFLDVVLLQRFLKLLVVFVAGGLTYGCLEVICRGYTFISMGIIGGACMVVLHLLNDERRNGTGLVPTIVVSTVFILSAEFLSGELLNRTFKLHIWSYEKLPLNFDGQICLFYAVVWSVLSFVGIAFDELIRLRIFRQKTCPLFVRKPKKIKI